MDETRELFVTTQPENSTAWRRIADRLAQELARGAWASGEVLPPAQDLAKQYGVHRHTVRQAYRHLHDLGLVNVRQGRGTFVAGAMPYRIGKRVSFRENLREMNIDPKARILAAEAVPADPETARQIGVPDNHPLWCLRLINLASGVPVSASTHYLDACRFENFPVLLEAADVSFTAAFRMAGVAAYARRSTRISARHAAEDGELLDIARDAIVLVARSIDETDGKAIQSIETIFRSDLIEFLVEGGP